MSTSPPLYEPRLCVVAKRADFDGYGFNLHAEKGKPGQYIGKVDENSPAEASGLRQGDRILEVNGHNINAESHKQVVERIKAVPNTTRLLVIDPKADIHNHQQMALIEKAKHPADAEPKTGGESELKAAANNNNNSNSKNNNNNNNNGSAQLIEEEKQAKKEHENGVSKVELKIEAIGNGNGSIKSTTSSQGSGAGDKLNLSMSVAEMRAQLKNKKRRDVKSEGIDVRKKYEIVQQM